MLIDATFFTKGLRQIENAVENPSNPNQIAVAKRIDGYVESYQTEFLLAVLGPVWCPRVEAYLMCDHSVQTDEATEGVEPTEEERTIQSIIELLKEPFADYVFFQMLRDMNVQATITGLVQLKCANTYVSPLGLGVRVWNNMVDKLSQFCKSVKGLGVDYVATRKDMLTYINTLNL